MAVCTPCGFDAEKKTTKTDNEYGLAPDHEPSATLHQPECQFQRFLMKIPPIPPDLGNGTQT